MPLPARESACKDLTTEDDSRTPIREGMILFNYYDGKWGVVGEISDWCAKEDCPNRKILFDGKWIHEDYNIDHEPDTEWVRGWFDFHHFIYKESGTISRGSTSLNGVRVSIYDPRGTTPPISKGGEILANWREHIEW